MPKPGTIAIPNSTPMPTANVGLVVHGVSSEIIPGKLYLGDQACAESPAELQRLNITHILSIMDGEVEYPASHAHPGRTLQIPIADRVHQDILDPLKKSLKWIEAAYRTDPNARVLVHCYMGKSRSASIVIGYLVSTTSMSVTEATAFVRHRREIIWPNKGFMRQLQQFGTWVEQDRQRTIETQSAPGADFNRRPFSWGHKKGRKKPRWPDKDNRRDENT